MPLALAVLALVILIVAAVALLVVIPNDDRPRR